MHNLIWAWVFGFIRYIAFWWIVVIIYLLHRYLMKVLQQVQSGLPVTGSASYLSKKRTQRATIDSRLQIDSLVAAFEHRAARYAKSYLSVIVFNSTHYYSTYFVSSSSNVQLCMVSLAYLMLSRFHSYVFMLYLGYCWHVCVHYCITYLL